MERQKRPFYIIGHNPNTLAEAIEYLEEGANALEPDIVYAEGQYFVSHNTHFSYSNIPTVQEYLQGLKLILIEKKYGLALIVWDMKNTDFDPNHFMDIVKQNFSGSPCDGVAMLITHSDNQNFLNLYSGNYANVGVGLDESNISPANLEKIFKNAGHKNFSYADGITTILNKPGVYKNITEAQHCRNKNEPDSFKLIYTWVLSLSGSLRKYLDTYIDGIMVDAGTVKRLKELILSAPYNEAYELAKNGYNPFTAIPSVKYFLTVETSDTFLSGTDARILFTLTGSSGHALKSLPFNGDLSGALERGSTTYITMEGLDIGEIEHLTVEALTDGIAADWLPKNICVESKAMDKKVNFVFNSNDSEEWVTRQGGAVIKFPA